MTQPNDTRLQAFDEARKLISMSRAKEILRWKNWRHGGVLGGSPKPTFPDITTKKTKLSAGSG